MAADEKLPKSVTLLKDLRPGLKNVTCVFIVIDKGTTNQTKDGSVVRKCRVADKSASVCFSLWNEQAAAIEAGDILKLTKGYTSLWKGAMVLYSGKYGRLEKIGEFSMVFSETPDMSSSTQEFLQRGPGAQQQPPPPNPPAGGRPPDHRGAPPNNASSNGPRTGTGPGGPPVSGNWNGNNHMGDGKTLDASATTNHVYHEPNHTPGAVNGYHHHPHPPSSQKPLTSGAGRGRMDPPHSGGPMKSAPHHNSYHPYHRPPVNHVPDARSGWR